MVRTTRRFASVSVFKQLSSIKSNPRILQGDLFVCPWVILINISRVGGQGLKALGSSLVLFGTSVMPRELHDSLQYMPSVLSSVGMKQLHPSQNHVFQVL